MVGCAVDGVDEVDESNIADNLRWVWISEISLFRWMETIHDCKT